jgi:WD40 repeat protein
LHANGRSDRTARIWDVDNGRELTVLRGHDDSIRGVAWSPDGRRLATASHDRKSGLGRRIRRRDHIVGTYVKAIEGVSWSPDGRRIASASRDKVCRIWDATISVEELVANAHRRVSRKLNVEDDET